ncbi:methyltransferase domain-containing protein [uncultured Thiodictyon sp.]|uniref:class I SAM-dependent methyltransferase n=1 Tax=uncultured Thiodictyon sp. TaxID=1846217 RepID=UPI0025CF0D6F|nr:methyltransferase domain-containing protein [uncultured Thiodictyon sp.]
MTDPLAYRCLELGCGGAPLIAGSEGLSCPRGHRVAFAPGSTVPVFARQRHDVNEYTRDDAAIIHDNALRWVFATFADDETALRTRLVARLRLAAGQRVLVTGAGAGNDLPFLIRGLAGRGEIYAQDIAEEMILTGWRRHRADPAAGGVALHFSVSDAADLPFPDGYFDAAYHFGGINLFPDVGMGIAEMTRVVRVGGSVLIGDEGVAPWLRGTEFGKMLICNNPLYAADLPLALLPAAARSVQLSWELSNCFYVIAYSVAAGPPSVDIDIPHVGTRGGSIRTRYFGQLEGVNPDLRDRVYAQAQRVGMSRVDYLESLIRAGLASASTTD